MSGRAAGHLWRWLATGFGVGYLWPAPGTMGSILGLAVFVPLLAPTSLGVQLIAWAALTVIGTWAAHRAAPGLGSKDPSEVVIDEVAAMWLATAGVSSAGGWVAAFFLFRVFDIIKPFPGRRLEALPGGFGIMADDVVAALYTQAFLWVGRAIWSGS